jgi:hypothetical protein
MKRMRKEKRSSALPGANRTRSAQGVPARPGDVSPKIDAGAAKLIVTEYCLFHYPTLYTAGVPSLLLDQQLWIVPIVLATPSRGLLGQVGELHVDARNGSVVASTSRNEVLTAGERLYKEIGDGSAPSVPARK